ncbi:MAG: isoaspartyl peptidase [Bacteroides sp. SM23_62_1]|nr:MAG: isoaspartyl peptidase [Bacteroides sp. SM23_62_1]
MKTIFHLLTVSLFIISGCFRIEPAEFVILVHGGSGNISSDNFPEEIREEYINVLSCALDTGFLLLRSGASSLDAVESAIRIMEDSPLFNAGKGAVFTHEGKNELDASIMDGSTLKAGAVASVTDIRNPISAARKVMENSEHVMLVGKGASVFARQQGLDIVDSSYFFTERRWRSLQQLLKEKGPEKYSTVGCVALDKNGNLAAGTSTGGMTNKMFGRIGDSPIIGAGTYANNTTCGVSATGHGEFFIRYTVAHDISALMEYKNLSLAEAARQVIHEKLEPAGGKGGIIAVDNQGNVVMEFNTSGMFRGYAKSTGEKKILMFGVE